MSHELILIQTEPQSVVWTRSYIRSGKRRPFKKMVVVSQHYCMQQNIPFFYLKNYLLFSHFKFFNQILIIKTLCIFDKLFLQ